MFFSACNIQSLGLRLRLSLETSESQSRSWFWSNESWIQVWLWSCVLSACCLAVVPCSGRILLSGCGSVFCLRHIMLCGYGFVFCLRVVWLWFRVLSVSYREYSKNVQDSPGICGMWPWSVVMSKILIKEPNPNPNPNPNPRFVICEDP